MNMETKGKRGKKPISYSEFIEAEKVFLAGKSKEKVAAFKALSEADKKRTLAQVKSRLKKQAGGVSVSESKKNGVLDAADSLFKSVKKEGSKLTEKQLLKLQEKLNEIKLKIEEAKELAKKNEAEKKQTKKQKVLAKKKAALEALKKEISRMEAQK
jgi:hypothetical protein